MSDFRSYFRLMRVPAVFTAIPDVVLGYVLATGSFEYGIHAAVLVLASMCLYLAGMIFNDLFDLRQDAIERPHRPLPAGKIRVRNAIRLGIGLVVAGVALASVAGLESGVIAGAIVVAILAYDGFAKQTVLGPVAMGLCRFLNVMLGASVTLRFTEGNLSAPTWQVACGLGIYIVGVTWFARTEARTSDRKNLIGGMTVVNAGAILLLLVMAIHKQRPYPELSAALLALVMFVINLRLVAAIRDPSPKRVQQGVRTMLLALILLDATLILWAGGGLWLAIGIAALLAPAIYLGRFMAVT